MEDDETLYLYTSLTAGSSHIVTATARLETILKANKLPFRAIDVATDDAARKLWGRRSRGRKLPGLVKEGMIVGDLEQIEEWNEYGELRLRVNNVDAYEDNAPTTATSATPTTGASNPAMESGPPKQSTIKIHDPPVKEQKDDSIAIAMRQAGEEAASKAKGNKDTSTATAKPTGAGPTESSNNTNADNNNTATRNGEQNSGDSVRRKSIIGEIAGEIKRPTLVPEDVAVSSANLHADNPAALRGHHRTSIVSATSQEERDQVAQDLRKSISGGHEEMIEPLRNGGDGKDSKGSPSTVETIEQNPVED